MVAQQHKHKVKKRLNKLIFGAHDPNELNSRDSVRHVTRIMNVWNSSQYNDFGIERIVRLLLVGSKIFFSGVYIEALSRKLTFHKQKIIGEFYVIFKTATPFIILYFGLWNYHWLYIFNIYLLIETFLHIFHKIFLPEHDQGRMPNRSIILLFFNFIEVIASFGVIYVAGDYLNMQLSWIDALYFSFITGVTIGYGDFYPVNEQGKILVMVQIMSKLAFLFLFFNFFAPRYEKPEQRHSNP